MGSAPSLNVDGAPRSVGRDTDALLDAVAEVIIQSQGGCLAAAENQILLEVSRAKNVRIEDVVLEQLAEASVDCTHTTDIRIGPLHNTLRDRLNQLVDSPAEDGGELTERVVEAVRADAISACFAQTMNQYKVQVEKAKGDVTVIDLDLKQLAKSNIKNCLASENVRAGDTSLLDMLEQQLPEHVLNWQAIEAASGDSCRRAAQIRIATIVVGVVAATIFTSMLIVFMGWYSGQ